MGMFEKPKHWREIAEEEKKEEEEAKKLGRVLKELPEEQEEEIETEKPTHWREIAAEEREEEAEEKEIMRVIKETPEEKLERLEGNLAKKEKEYKRLKSIRTFFGLSKNKEKKAEIEKEYEEARAKAEETRKEYITKQESDEKEYKEKDFDSIDITRKQYLQAVERKWGGYKIGGLKAKYKEAWNKLDEEAKETKLDKEKEYLKEAGIKKRDINYILG